MARLLHLRGASAVSGPQGFSGATPAEAGDGEFMVGDTGIEPVTPSMSTKCSTAELIALTRSRPAPNKWGAEARAGSQGYKRSRKRDQGLLATKNISLYSML